MEEKASRPVIECDNVTHRFGARTIYSGLSFKVEEGQTLGLLGKNGTGKTTIINILNGYLRPTSGHCRIWGEDSSNLSPATKARIGLQLEGHVQHTYFDVREIEKFYSKFFEKWNSDAYYSLISRLRISPRQKISTMSCGQRSQVALGLIMAQNPDLLILDDFSMGLDPGYRRLFVEKLKDFSLMGTEGHPKTMFVTSHIIQDMEKVVSHCMIFDYGRVICQVKTSELLEKIRRYTFVSGMDEAPSSSKLINVERIRGNQWEAYSMEGEGLAREEIDKIGGREVTVERLNLHDAFIGLTGKY